MKPNNSTSAFSSHSTGTSSGTEMTTDGTTYHHMVCTFNNSTGMATYYQDGTQVWFQKDISVDESIFPITSSNTSKIGEAVYVGDLNMKYFRIWTNYALTTYHINNLYANRNTNIFSFANMRINYGDVYLGQTVNKTIEDYKNENIPLHDISFGAFPSTNKYKQSYVSTLAIL